MIRAALLLALFACGEDRPTKRALPIEQPVSAWKLSRAEWTATVVEPYTRYYDDYARAFDAAAPALTQQIAASNKALTSRAHYAGDPQLTRGQARARWALPVQFPSEVAMLDGAPLDVVFVPIGTSYKAIAGIDQLVVDKTRALDETCATYLETLGAKPCQVVAWAIADAALRGDDSRLRHACSLAASQCAN